jgi:hypothetical protein
VISYVPSKRLPTSLWVSLKRGSKSKTICKKSPQVSNALHNVFFLGKEQLEELKNIKKVKEPVMTAEERASKINKQEIKGTGNILALIKYK